MAHAIQENRPLVSPSVRAERLRVAVRLAGAAFVTALRRPWRCAGRVSVPAVSDRWLQQHGLGVGKQGELP